MNKAVAKPSREALEIELDSAWEYGRQQEESAIGYRAQVDSFSHSLRRIYPFETAIRNIRGILEDLSQGRESAEAALEAIRNTVARCEQRVADIEDAHKAAQ